MQKTIRVKFAQPYGAEMHANPRQRTLTDKNYEYFLVPSDQEKSLAKGSLAVVEVEGVLRIVAICGVGAFTGRATKYAIAVFNLDEHRAIVENQENIRELETAILLRAETARKRNELRLLAEHDTELKRMLEELTALETGAATETGEINPQP